jgi:hypothetical protein
MSNYTRTTDFFSIKDTAPINDPTKVIKGSEFDSEFNAIATAVATKADSASPSLTGVVTFTDSATIPTANITTGNIVGANITSLVLNGTSVTATANELNLLDGAVGGAPSAGTAVVYGALLEIDAVFYKINGVSVSASAAEVNLLTGATGGTVVNDKAVIYDSAGKVSATSLELDGVGVTASAAELNTLTGVTATVDELNILDGVTANATELNLLDGVTAIPAYASGDWTPEVADAVTGGNVATTSSSVGRYVKIGDFVQVNMIITNVDTTGLTGSNQIFVRNLPFTARDTTPTSFYLGVAQLYNTGASTTGTLWVPTLYDDQSVIRFQAIGNNSPIPDSLTVAEVTSTTADFYVTLQYEAASV